MHRTTFSLWAIIVAFTVFIGLPSIPFTEARPLQRVLMESVLTGTEPTMESDQNFSPPFRAAGRHIVDSNGKRLKLASINWYGASDVYFVAGGLDFRHRDDIARTIREMGFNSVRFPYSDQMVIENAIIPPELISSNLDLIEMYGAKQNSSDGGEVPGVRALDVYKACVDAMTDAGLVVIPNNHITNAHWCDGKNLCDSSWKNDQYGSLCKVRQTTESWIEHWKTIMEPHIDNGLVIGADLRNEPRGLWGTMSWDMWATAAEQASEELLKMQPNWLMFVEGIGSANDCSGARERPVKLSIPERVVYSAHVYKWSGWSTLVPYGKRPYPSFALDMERNWGYLLRGDIAPVWVGEFGAPHGGNDGDHHYWNNLMKYLRDVDADWGYWALNPRKPENYDNETYGLLADDWETVVDDWRIKDLLKLVAPRRHPS
ncbi:glycoside hydrolase family 5 protein [Baudoinia panamericana UAMH 10762]|uniref:Glycoside hydrolase family 5 protein n=1 Tax=Baudoinia panamericana (strain UAMH 10762) TaxID=717646 RepID=M2NAW5_BAUPA|nr:glycoside hydrolase family 5 protein [Baudoinia panamericana UAMH 10762]EMC96289.1 glycoside hydrolase family 5 protein [Baudoinia panamericana UAMH 10762]